MDDHHTMRSARCVAMGDALRRWFWPDANFLAVGKIDGRGQDHLVAVLDARVHLDCRAEVAHHVDAVQMGGSIFDDRDAEAFGVEDDRFRWQDQRWRLSFFFNVATATDFYTLSLHDALPI